MTAPAGFELERVTVRYESGAALSDVSLRIEPGEAVALVGPSGAGKTTLLRLLNGSVRPSDGVVRVQGQPLRDMTPGELRRLRTSIGVIHQDLRLVPSLRVLKNVIAGRLGRLSLVNSLRAMLWPSWHLVLEAHAVLDRVGIAEKLYARTDRLSGGQRQRVAIARALFQEPSVLIADEPVANVDPARARDTVQLLVDLSREHGITLCASLHNVDLASEFFPRLVGLREGRIVFDRPPRSIAAHDVETLYDLNMTRAVRHGS